MIAPGDLSLGYVEAYSKIEMHPVSFIRHVGIARGGSVSSTTKSMKNFQVPTLSDFSDPFC